MKKMRERKSSERIDKLLKLLNDNIIQFCRKEENVFMHKHTHMYTYIYTYTFGRGGGRTYSEK